MSRQDMSDEKEIIYAEVVEGDYNDVYSRKTVKGTWKQIEEYVKDHFSEEGLKLAEDVSGLGVFGLEIYYDKEDDEEAEDDDDIEILCKYGVVAQEVEPYDDEEIIDLGES